MSEDLKELLHETADVDFTAPDLATITRQGDRTVRRRRALAGVAGIAAATVVGAGALAIGGAGETPVASDDGAAAIDAGDPTWVETDTLHTPDGKVELGFEVRSYVRTAAGFAFVDAGGGVHTYVDGTLKEIGRTSVKPRPVAAELIGDDDGTTVAWVMADEPDLLVHDLATGTAQRVALGPHGMDQAELSAQSYALDDSRVYIGGPQQFEVIDLATGTADGTASSDGSEGAYLFDVEDGLVARLAETRGGGDIGAEVLDEAGNRVALYENAANLVFAPDASWAVMNDGPVPIIVQVRGDGRLQLDVGRGAEGLAFEWLDTGTLAVAAIGEGESVAIHTCEVPAGGCQEVADLGPFDDGEDGLVLPDGRYWGS